MDAKQEIQQLIDRLLRERESEPECTVRWGSPLVGFADAKGAAVAALRTCAAPSHRAPEEILPEARIVVCYFLPFTKELERSNCAPGTEPSRAWAEAYEETNRMIRRINQALIGFLESRGIPAAEPEAAFRFDRQRLTSDWSQRHLAWAAGLGTFGINNMLITPSGCCGRLGSIVTALEEPADSPMEGELCIYKRSRQCRACILRCASQALTERGFDRQKCFGVVRQNAARFPDLGDSYGSGPGEGGSEVCGKCTTCIPCAFLTQGKVGSPAR